MKAIFINAVEQKVEAVNVENELHTIYKQIGCGMIQCIDLGENHTLICDEEGRLKEQSCRVSDASKHFFLGEKGLLVFLKEDFYNSHHISEL